VGFDPKKEGPWAALAALVGVVSLWPYLWVVGLGAMSRDAVLWIERSQVGRPKFVEWIFWSQHFNVGYRPVTGLSYALNAAVGGYRVTDLLLHALCVVLVHLTYRRLAPTLPAWGGVVGAVVMACHPLVEFVVPHLARRGYPLATALSLGGLALLTSRGPARFLGAVLIGLAALSNDAAYAVFVVGAGLVWTRDRDKGSLASLGLVLLLLLAVRFVVIGGVGGYEATDRVGRIVPIYFATWDRLLPMFGPIELPLGALRTAVAGVLSVVLAGAVAWGSAVDAEHRWAAVVPLAWLVGLTLLFLPNGVWFPRQVYLMLAPLALVVSVLVVQLTRDPMTWARAAPALLVVAAVLVRSPVFTGTDPAQRLAWAETERVVADLTTAMAQVKRREEVSLVVPFYKRPSQQGLRAREGDERRRADPLGARIVEQRVENLLGRAKQMHSAALLFTDPADERPFVTVTEAGPGSYEVVASPHTRLSLYAGELSSDSDEGGRGTISVPSGWLYVHDGVEGRLQRVP